jgi:hypothetical protein
VKDTTDITAVNFSRTMRVTRHHSRPCGQAVPLLPSKSPSSLMLSSMNGTGRLARCWDVGRSHLLDEFMIAFLDGVLTMALIAIKVRRDRLYSFSFCGGFILFVHSFLP